MANRQHPHVIADWVETVKGQVAGLAVGNHQLTQAFLGGPTDLRVARKQVNGFHDGSHRFCGDGLARLFQHEIVQTLDVCPGARRVTYARHGVSFGFAVFLPASRARQ